MSTYHVESFKVTNDTVSFLRSEDVAGFHCADDLIASMTLAHPDTDIDALIEDMGGRYGVDVDPFDTPGALMDLLEAMDDDTEMMCLVENVRYEFTRSE